MYNSAVSLGIDKMKKMVKMTKQVKIIKLVIMRLRNVLGSWRTKVNLRLCRTEVSLTLPGYSVRPEATINWDQP